MKVFIVLAIVACAYAKPQYIGYSGLGYGIAGLNYGVPTYTYAAPAIIAPAVTKSQYHAQDELGQASYGYAHPGQAHAALRDAFGNVRGAYAYVDPNGKEVRVNYIADAGGFRVESNALPEGPAVPVSPPLVAPLPVSDTPEVAEAKAAHAKAVEEAKVRNAAADAADEAKPESRRKRGLEYTYAVGSPVLSSSILGSPLLASHHVLGSHQVLASPLVSTYAAAAPALTYSVVAAPTVVAAAHPVREATLTRVVNTPGHAVSYRVD